ncbi:hypothetical protein ABPG74_009646 [Tetrahymena malaccensis]
MKRDFSLLNKLIFSLVYLILNIRLYNGEPCTFRNTPFPKEYVFQTTTIVSQQIKSYYYLNSTQNPQGKPFLYILRNSGQQSIIDLTSSSILNSFSISNSDVLTSSWNFGVQQTILYHILDLSGNVYEVDGSYGSQVNFFASPFTSSQKNLIASSPCISMIHSVYVTFSGNQLYFVYYRLPTTSSQRVVTLNLSQFGTNISIQGCIIQNSNLDNVVIFAQNPITTFQFSLTNPTLPQVPENLLQGITANLSFYGAQGAYRYFSYTPDTKNYFIVIYLNGVQAGSYSQTASYVAIKLDTKNNRFIFTDTTVQANILNIADNTVVATLKFTEATIDFSESNQQVSDSQQSTYIKSLSINQINIYQDSTNDYIILRGSQTFFVYKYSQFTPVLFKDITLASNQILGFILYNNQIIAVGDIQVTFVSIQSTKINQLNFNGINLITDNNQFLQSQMDFTYDRVVFSTSANQIIINQLSSLTFEKMLVNSNMSGLRFQIISPNNKMLVYYIITSGNSQLTDSRKYQIQVFDYKATNLLYTITNANNYSIQQLLYDSNTLDCFFILQSSALSIVHRRFQQNTEETPLGTYILGAWTSIQAFLVTSLKKLVVSTNNSIYVFDYSDPINSFKANPTLTYTVSQVLSTFIIQSNVVLGYLTSGNFGVYDVTQVNQKNINIPNISSVDSIFAADMSGNNQVAIGYIISGQYIASVVNTQTQVVVKSQNLSTKESGSNIAIDTTLGQLIVVGNQGTVFILNYNDPALPILSKPNFLTGQVSMSLIDLNNQIVNIFYSDTTYVKINYKTGQLMKLQQIQQIPLSVQIHPSGQVISILLQNSHVIQLNYKEQQTTLQAKQPSNLNAPSQLEIDPDRGLIYLYYGFNLYVYSFWEQNKLLKTVVVNPTPTMPYFIYDIKYSQKMNAIFFITYMGQTIYHLSYTDFSQIATYQSPYIDGSIQNVAITIDDNMNRVFIASTKGSWCYFNYDPQTNKLVNPQSYMKTLGSITSPLYAIQFDIQKNLVLITSAGYQGQLLYYDTLKTAIYSIPGHQGEIVPNLNIFFMFQTNNPGTVWLYNTQTFNLIWNQQINQVGIGYMTVFQESQYSQPSIIIGGQDKYLYYIPNLTLSNMRTYLHDSPFRAGIKPLTTGYFDLSSNQMIICDGKGALQIFSIPSMSLKYQFIPSTATTNSFQLNFVQDFNTVVFLQGNNQISYVNYYNILNQEYQNNYQGYYGKFFLFLFYFFQSYYFFIGISDMITQNNIAYTTDALGLIQKWDQTANQQTYITYQKRGYYEYTKGQLKQISGTNFVLGLYPKQVLKIDLSTLKVVGTLNQGYCTIIQYFSSANFIVCIFFNVVQIYDTNLASLSTITVTSPTTLAITDVQINVQFQHLILTQTSGDLQIYRYDSYALVATINPPSAQTFLRLKLIDSQNNLIVIAYSDGSIFSQTYSQTQIGSRQALSLYPYSQVTYPIIILQVINNKYLLIRRVNEPFVQILNYPSLSLYRQQNTQDNILDSNPQRLGVLYSPCTGPDSQIYENQPSLYFAIICAGQYNFYSSADLSKIGNIRQIYNITSTFSNFQTQKASSFRFINENYFINSFYQSLFIFYINAATKTLTYLGSYQNNDSVQYINSLSLINKSDNSGVYGIQLTIYSYIAMEQIVIPLVSIDTCQFSTSAQLFAGSLTNLETTYKQMKLFSVVNNFRLLITLTEGISLPLFPSFSFSSQSSLVFTPVGVDSPPSTASQQSVRIKVYGSTQFFLSASKYNQLVMNNLNLIFISNPLQSPISILTLPLTSVQLLYIDIQSNVSGQQIIFQSVQQVKFSQISINYTPQQTQSRLLKEKRQLQATTTSTYTQGSYLSFTDIQNIYIQGITIKGQTLTDLTLFDIRNNGEDFSQNPNLSTSSVTLDTFTIQGNTIISNIPQNLQLSQVNSIIHFSLIPSVIINNFQITDNKSDQSSMQGIVNLEAVKNFQANNCQFTNNINLFLIQSNTTYASISTSSSSTFNTKKYYQLQGTSVTLNVITMTANTYNWYVQSLLLINSETLKGTSIYAYTNKLVDVSSPASNNLVNQASIFNCISIVNINLSDVKFSSNTNFQLGLLKIQNSVKAQIDQLNFNLNTLQSGTLYLIGISSLTITNSQFQNNKCQVQGCSIYSSSSSLQLNTVIFTSENSSSNGGSIYLQSSSSLGLSACTFSSITSSGQGGAIYSDNSIITIQGTTFTSCQSVGQGGTIYATKSQINLDTTTITQSSSQNYGGAISAISYSVLTCNKCTFTQNTAKNGGALYLQNVFSSSDIESSTFSSNTAYGSGGALMLDSSDIQVQGTQFMQNKAGYGGAIRYIGLIPRFLLQILPSDLRATKDANGLWSIKGNYYLNNVAYILGPDIGSLFTIISPTINTKNFNFETIVPDSPTEKNYTPDNFVYEYRLSNFRSGESNFQFNIVLYDTLNQTINAQYASILPSGYKLSQEILDEINNINVKVQELNSLAKIEQQTISIDGSIIVDYKQSKNDTFYGAQLDSISISGVPGKSGSFCLQFNGLSRINPTNFFVSSECINFFVEFRNCVRGEIYLPRCSNCIINQCDICANGTYSLIEPQINSGLQCKPCQTQYTSNCYSDQMSVLPGYWRTSVLSDEFYPCDNKYKSCNGNQTANYCAEGFMGALCQQCDQTGQVWSTRYGLTSLYSNLTCQKCSEMASQISSQIVFLTFTGLYIFFQIYSNIQSSINYIKGQVIKQLNIYMVQNSLVKYELSVLSKFLIHYMTVQEIISQLTISNKNFSDQVYSVPKELLIPVQNLFYGFDCYLSDPSSVFSSYPIEYARLLFTFVQCAFLFALVIIFYALFLLISIIRKEKIHYLISLYLLPSPLISSALFLMYFFQQTLTSTSLQVITCQTVGDQYYMQSQMSKQCYTDEYFRWFPLLILTFIFSTFIYPLIILLILYRNREKIYNQSRLVKLQNSMQIQKDQSLRDGSKIYSQDAQKLDFNTSVRSQNANNSLNNQNNRIVEKYQRYKTFYYKTYRRYGFLYFEFKPDYWWWEIMKMTMRQVIIILTQLSLFQILEKVSLIVLILFLYQLLQLKIQPYRNQKLNQIDFMLNALSIIIIILGLYSQGITNDIHKQILSVIIIALKFFVLGFIILRLFESFLAQQIFTIKNSKSLCIFKILGEFFREEIFFRKDGVMRRNFPTLYLLMHKPELIGIDKHYRWKLIQVHIMDFIRERRINGNTVDFMQVAQSKNSKILEESQDIKSRYKVLKSYSKNQVKDSINQPTTNTPKTSQFRNLQVKYTNSPVQTGRSNNNFLKNIQQQHSIVEQLDLQDQTNVNTPGAGSKFQTSRYNQYDNDASKNQFQSSEAFQGKQSETQLIKPNFSQTMLRMNVGSQDKQKSLNIDNDTDVSNPDIFNDQNERGLEDDNKNLQKNYCTELNPKGRITLSRLTQFQLEDSQNTSGAANKLYFKANNQEEELVIKNKYKSQGDSEGKQSDNGPTKSNLQNGLKKQIEQKELTNLNSNGVVSKSKGLGTKQDKKDDIQNGSKTSQEEQLIQNGYNQDE